MFKHSALKGLGLVLIILFITVAAWPIPTLVVADRQGNNKIILPLIGESKFSLNYVHSVQKTPVQEHFIPAPGNQLLLTSTTYQSLGVGLPFLPEEGTLTNQNGLFVLTGLNRLYPEIHIGFMPLAQQGLSYRHRTYMFNDYFQSGSHIVVKICTYSPLKLLWALLPQ